MNKRISIVCSTAGILLMLGSGYLQLFNLAQDREAADAAAQLLPQIKAQIQINPDSPSEPEAEVLPLQAEEETCIGYLSIPALELELPVLEDWSYEKLKKAPCRFTGSLWEDSLVIMAHNYAHHFGKLSTLSPGDCIFFTDMQGLSSHFLIAQMDILSPTAVEEVTQSSHDLTLFTCTYGGKNRVVVYCDRVIGQ